MARLLQLFILSGFFYQATAQIKTVEVGMETDSSQLILRAKDNTDVLIWDKGNAKIRNHYDLLSTKRDWIRILLDSDNNQTNAEFAIYKDSTSSGSKIPEVLFNLDGFDSWLNLGKIGIGTHQPTEKLTVEGAIKIGNSNTSTAGVIRFKNNEFEGHNGTTWKSLTAGASGGGSLIQDADQDTKITTELSPDEDLIRLSIKGSERVLLDNSNLAIKGDASVENKITTNSLKVTGGAITGYVLKSDNQGNATWQPDNVGSGSGGVNGWTVASNNVYKNVSGNVGIGSTSPLSLLSIGGNGSATTTTSITSLQENGKALSVSLQPTIDPFVTSYTGHFINNTRQGIAVYGENTSSEYNGINNTPKYGGYFKGNGTYGNGVGGTATSASGAGVIGLHEGSGSAVQGYTVNGTGVRGISENSTGGYFHSEGGIGATISTHGDGEKGLNVLSTGANGIAASIANDSTGFGLIVTTFGPGIATIWAVNNNATSKAAQFNGNVQVTGTLSKSAGSFKIDHPDDPENKYLSHSFVESPDMMNVYNGNIHTNDKGFATIKLPDYFESLNKDFRYQLTVIGTFAQAIVKEKVKNNQFIIQTNEANVEVSWQVTGIRKDAYAEANRIPEVEDKKPEEKGKYFFPELYGKSKKDCLNCDPKQHQKVSYVHE